MIVVKDAKFLTSATKLADCPHPDLMEVVFLGRSNVGKSTFINLILGKNLAKSSSTPGKTQLINFFTSIWERKEPDSQIISFRFVDLPGFGYAKVSKEIKKKWEDNLWEFLSKRVSVKLFVHLIDARHTELEIDNYVNEALENILRNDQRILNIYTKFDKLNKSQQHLFYQKGRVVASNNDKIIDKRYGGKTKIQEIILNGVLGIGTD
ncbi:YihA family ribosome biogenesis GTP-binding protein [Helicobacter sp. 12S02232-10]|uniref:ribosome biogenesis GTP-binding protein YihA/YsxC n=1 Tax=Helicobacter sp. 12S02232-10 TaxID=1476197 RepID=UPI000BA78964|nr:ribosome biogenesis GTP-binding protein YihA/YsxC [Helicobacter sp. 12S02232-10]PAF47646.1 YihA family ribosome biogenesis GTP-binding protein [Helicobacter sp. 12S02232-10]